MPDASVLFGGPDRLFGRWFAPDLPETIFVTVVDADYIPISGIPAPSIQLQWTDGSVVTCGAIADHATDSMGRTVFTGPVSAGGYNQFSGPEVVVLGINIGGTIQLETNSPDINADGVVNLSDIVKMVTTVGASCP